MLVVILILIALLLGLFLGLALYPLFVTIEIEIFSGIILLLLLPYLKWLTNLLLPYIQETIKRNNGKKNNRREQIRKWNAWLSMKEDPCTGPLHFLDKKINSVEFGQLRPYLSQKESSSIDKIYHQAKGNDVQIFTVPNYTAEICQKESVPLSRELIIIVSEAISRIEKKWKLI